MMDDTPRTFVGCAAFALTGSPRLRAAALSDAVLGTPGVTHVLVDAVGGWLVVVVDRPVDRADIAVAVARAGHAIA